MTAGGNMWIWSLAAAGVVAGAITVTNLRWRDPNNLTLGARLQRGSELVVGQQYTYSLDYHAEGTAHLNGIAGALQSPSQAPSQPQTIAGALRGTWVQTVVGQVGADYEVVAVINTTAVDLKVGAQVASGELSAVAGKPWRYHVNALGTISGIDLPEEFGVIGRNFVRSLLTASRVSWPEGTATSAASSASKAFWQAEERGLYGALLADYTADSKNGLQGLHKVLQVKKVAGAGAGTAVQVNGAAHIALLPTGTGWSAIDFWQEVAQQSAGKTVAHHREAWALKLLSTEASAAKALATLRRPGLRDVKASLNGDEEIAWQQQKRYERLIATSSLEATLADADAQVVGSVAKVPSDVIERLKAFLALSPDAPSLVAQHLAAAATGGVPFNVYLSVLAGDSSEPSQAVLRAESQVRTNDQRGTFAILSSLALVARPSAETAHFFDDLSASSADREVRRVSLLAYSVVGHTRLVLDPQDAVAEAVYAKVATLFRQPTGDWDRDLALVALGNAGRSEAYALIAPVAKSDTSASTRQVAVQALRHIGGANAEASENAILDALQHDTAPGVRAAAADALQFHGLTPAAVSILLQQLKTERSPIALQAILKQVSTAAMDDADARAGLKSFADQCGTHNICHYAQTLALVARPAS